MVIAMRNSSVEVIVGCAERSASGWPEAMISGAEQFWRLGRLSGCGAKCVIQRSR